MYNQTLFSASSNTVQYTYDVIHNDSHVRFYILLRSLLENNYILH